MQDSASPQRNRDPHASVDRASRTLKAKKIIALVGQDRFQRATRILEVGCGSGVISSLLSEICGPTQTIDAVDVTDSRIETSGFRFTLVDGTDLPFSDSEFDLVLTNHVIEHVGDETAQLNHLREIRRVLRSDGAVYFAAPNKWRLIEPHFGLPLLSWFPQRASDWYVRAMERGTHYDCFPRSLRNLRRIIRTAGFDCKNQTAQAIRATLAIEHHSRAATHIADMLPDALLTLGTPIMPTFVFQLFPSATR